jgi:hypothetical protein
MTILTKNFAELRAEVEKHVAAEAAARLRQRDTLLRLIREAPLAQYNRSN